MPAWYQLRPAARPPGRSASRSSRPWRGTAASSSTRRSCALLRMVNGISPRLGDLRRCAGSSDGAWRRDERCRSKPPVKPQLARSAKELPEGDEWRYEPKWDGFRTIVFRDGDDVQLQSRNGKPMNRYFPEIVEQVLELPHERLVLDGEMMVVVDGVQEFDLLSPAHPPGRVARRAAAPRRRPPRSWPSTCSPRATRLLLELPYDGAPRAARGGGGRPGAAHADDARPRGGRRVAHRHVRGRDRQAGRRPVPARASAPAWSKIKRVRTADAVVVAFRFGKEEGTVGSLILGMYDDDGRAARGGPHVGLPRQAEARAARAARALPHRRARLGRAEPLEVRRGARLGGPAARARRARSPSTTSPATASATAPSCCAGATTRTRASATSRSCVPDPAGGGPGRPCRAPRPAPRSTRRACATRTAGPSTG